MPAAERHARYQEQAQWTKALRLYLLSKIPLNPNWSVLELGCGTGAILQDFTSMSEKVIGLDTDMDALIFQGPSTVFLVNADAYHPPFQEKCFDLIYCHYFLLWLENPTAVLEAAKKMLKPGGYLAVCAEPDYASRQTAPETVKKLADLQNQSLAAQGAYLKIGRQLGRLLTGSGFTLVEFGTIREVFGSSQPFAESEKNVLRTDWQFLHQIRQVEIDKEELESHLLLTPERWYVPTYYALAALKK